LPNSNIIASVGRVQGNGERATCELLIWDAKTGEIYFNRPWVFDEIASAWPKVGNAPAKLAISELVSSPDGRRLALVHSSVTSEFKKEGMNEKEPPPFMAIVVCDTTGKVLFATKVDR